MPAILLSGGAADQIAVAAGAGTSEEAPKAEVGDKALKPAKVQEMQSDLKENPPKPFDITRRLNVFTSKVQYVQFSASNYRLMTRQIPLPPELVDVADDDLKDRITSLLTVGKRAALMRRSTMRPSRSTSSSSARRRR